MHAFWSLWPPPPPVVVLVVVSAGPCLGIFARLVWHNVRNIKTVLLTANLFITSLAIIHLNSYTAGLQIFLVGQLVTPVF